MKRDYFTCKICGSSPAKDNSITLHVDHIIPFSKGGENFRTVIIDCDSYKPIYIYTWLNLFDD